MFADPVSNLMLIILLFFAGLLAVFIFILRSLELNAQNQEETRGQLAVSLTDLERALAELTFALREKGLIEIASLSECRPGKPERPAGRSAGYSLDDLSSLFDDFSGSDAGSEEERAQPETARPNGGKRD